MPLLAICSDAHGNAQATEVVLKDIESQKPDETYFLGDQVNYGADSPLVMDMLASSPLNIRKILGNHDVAGAAELDDEDTVEGWYPQPIASVLKVREQLSPEQKAALLELPTHITEHDIRFVHGCPPDSYNIYTNNVFHNKGPAKLLEQMKSIPEMTCFAGHSHMFERFQQNGDTCRSYPLEDTNSIFLNTQTRNLVNVGSIGQPRDGLSGKESWAKYVLYNTETKALTPRAVEYPVEAAIDRIKQEGFPEFNGTRLRRINA